MSQIRLPKDWDEVTLAEIGAFKNGINKGSDSFGHGFPFVNLMDVFGVTEINDTATLGLINSSEIERRTYDLREGDVLFVRSSVKPTGVGLSTLVVRSLPDTVFSGFLLRFRSDSRLANSFKAYLFSEAGFRSRVIGASTVSANTNINQRSLGSLTVRFPRSKAEQESIAEALSDADDLIATLERLIAKKQAIKQGMMQQLLTGKTRLPGFTAPWGTTTIGDACITFSGGTPSTAHPEYYRGKIPWIASGDLNKYRIESVDGRISHLGLKRSAAKLVPAGTPLIALYGATAGVTAMTQIEGAINQAVLAMVPRKIDTEFLFQWLSANRGPIIDRYTQGGQPNLSGAIVRSIEVPLPDPIEQRRIGGALRELDRLLATLVRRLRKAKAVKQGMMQELLTGRTRLPVAEAAS
jgi:type I restriction enzyme S subunit